MIKFSNVLFLFIFYFTFSATGKKPNVILILTDDQGYGDVNAHGHPYLKTPNINKFKSQSVSFENFYVSPSCSPTRAALLTGVHEFKNGVTHTINPRQQLHKSAILFTELLKNNGYLNAFIGKWHLGNNPGPDKRGFDWCSTNVGGPNKHFDTMIIRNRKRINTVGFREDAFFDEAIHFIKENKENPFFCYLSTYSPHTPLGAPKHFIKPFKDAGLNDTHATYLAMIENIDYNLGRLMDFLKHSNLEKDTIVILINDNGVTEGLDIFNANMRGSKCTAWEGGSRAFSFWHFPSKWKSKKVNNLTAHLDIFPTICELTETSIPSQIKSKLDGYSLCPLLENPQPFIWNPDRILFHHVARWPSGLAKDHKYSMASVRSGNHLLLRSHDCGKIECTKYSSQCQALRIIAKGGKNMTYANGTAQFHWGVSPKDRWALFDVKKDPGCRNDLYEKQPQLVSKLSSEYEKWWEDIFPTMISKGGDLGDPNEAKRVAKKKKGEK